LKSGIVVLPEPLREEMEEVVSDKRRGKRED